MLSQSLFSEFYLNRRKEKNQPADSRETIGNLAVDPKNNEKQPVMSMRSPSRTWWESAWNR